MPFTFFTLSKNLEKTGTIWKKIIEQEMNKPSFHHLQKFLEEEISDKKTLYPSPENIFSAFEYTHFEDIKVVILGQDPYHGKNQAHGLSFSVPESQTKIPPSLRNIFKEIETEFPDTEKFLGKAGSGNLEYLAKQGVLLLNATLTVEAEKAGSHQKKGWETFTDSIIQKISDEHENIVFLLWGGFARKKSILINQKKHLILEAPHPSPLSSYRGFFGCNHFIQANEYVKNSGKKEILWR